MVSGGLDPERLLHLGYCRRLFVELLLLRLVQCSQLLSIEPNLDKFCLLQGSEDFPLFGSLDHDSVDLVLGNPLCCQLVSCSVSCLFLRGLFCHLQYPPQLRGLLSK